MSEFHHARRLTSGILVGLAFLLMFIVARPKGLAPANEAPQHDNIKAEMPNVDYARACLRLAEAELDEAREQNLRSRDSVTAYDLERLQMHVRLANQNVSYAEQGADYSHSILGHIELQSRLSQWDLNSAEKSRATKEDSISDAQLERLRSYAEVCRLRMDLVRNPVNALQLVDHLHWETHRLSEEILLLNRRVERLEERTR